MAANLDTGPFDPRPGATIGGFRLVVPIGRGGMGRVWEAVQVALNRPVALKLLAPHLSLDPEALMRFQREAEAGGRLEHPNVVRVHAFGEERGVAWIAQELVRGGRTLADLLADLRRAPQLPDDHYSWTARLFANVADALQAAHDVGVIHRDVKPSNVLIDRDASPKVADFGLAHVEDALSLSRSGDFTGTPFYMSPEQAMARRIGLDHRTDVFSFGSTLYEALTLSRPFHGDSSHEVLEKIVLEEPANPRRLHAGVPRDLAVICLKCLEKKRERRYSTMREVADELRRFLANGPILARPPGPLRRAEKWARRHPALASTGAVLSVALAVVLALLVENAQRRVEAEEARSDYMLLADQLAVPALLAEEPTLYPVAPESESRLVSWLERADEHGSREIQWRALLASTGASDLDELIGSLDRLRGVVPAVEQRLQDARTLAQRTSEHPRWAEAIADIASLEVYRLPDGSPLAIEPQLGLVPLGRNAETGLWEFWHVGTGAQPEVDPETGALDVRPEDGLVLVLIPGAEDFVVGSKFKAEEPLQRTRVVDLDPFFLARAEVTQGQWLALMRTNPSSFHRARVIEELTFDDTHPAENLSWHDAAEFARRAGLTLASEAQWEYAARAGSRTFTCWGDRDADLSGLENIRGLESALEVGEAPWDDVTEYTAPVAALAFNGFGLYDVSGNVGEWLQDDYVKFPEDQGLPGTGLILDAAAEKKIFRGASWYTVFGSHAVAFRNAADPRQFNHARGARLARALDS